MVSGDRGLLLAVGEPSVSPRVIAALRELADAYEEVAEGGTRPTGGARKRAGSRRPRVPVAPDTAAVSDVDRAAARAFLKRSGFVEVK